MASVNLVFSLFTAFMECVSKEIPPHPGDPQSGGSREATARSRAFNKLARSSAPIEDTKPK